jgi:hypothetical protein
MDIDGAKALKERLARSGRALARTASLDVPADAPPVYHWFGHGRKADGAAPAPDDGASQEDGSASLGRDLDFPPAAG